MSTRSQNNMAVTLLLLTLNEIDGMKLIMPRVKPEWVEEILVMDGGSTDGTVEYAKTQGYRVMKQKMEGVTAAYWEGVEAAQGDVVIAFSPDGNSVPERIPELIDKMRLGFDMVIVSRYLEGAKSEDDDPVTAFGNRLFTGMINIFFGGHYTDTLVIFRAWRKTLLPMLKKNLSRAGLETQLSILCAKRKLKVAEIPGDEPKRIGGIRKMSPILNGSAVLVMIIQELFSPR